jgi:autonomous glycyl radical cofactor GrcA
MALLQSWEPEVQNVVKARLAVKSTLAESRAQRLLNLSELGPLNVPLNYAGAINTSRFSGAELINLQNLTRGSKLRDAVEAPEDHVLVVIDSTGIELRTAATLCGQTDIIERAERKEDEYARFAGIVFSRPINKATDKHERQVGKVAVLSLGYQSGAATYRGMLFSQTAIILPIQQCQEVVSTYRTTYAHYPATWKLLDKMLEMMCVGEVPPNLPSNPPVIWERDGFISTYSGTKVSYPNIRWDLDAEPHPFHGRPKVYHDERRTEGKANIYGGKCLENLSQFIAREVVNYQTHLIWAATGMRPALQVHDELIYAVPTPKADLFYHLAKRLMTGPVPFWPALVTAASGGVAKSYGAIDK